MDWLKKLFSKPSSSPLSVKLHSILGFYPDNLLWYQKAFTHSSLEHPTHGNNERLEFLGDSILDSVIAEYLFLSLPNKDEGVLTDLKSKMVSRRTLNKLAKEFCIDQLIESKLPGKIPSSVLGNAFEALIAAIYLDKGRSFCEKFIIDKIITKHFDLNSLEKEISSYKKHLIHWVQKSNTASFQFKLLKESGESHKKEFQIALYINEEKIASAIASSKKQAEEIAAKNACKKLNI